MDARELRICNFVFNKAKERVRLKGVYADASVYDPIPLNEEWLLKFGFVKYEWMNGYYIPMFNTYLMIQFFKDKMLMFTTKVSKDKHGDKMDVRSYLPSIQLQYVHQLQNLYFALTGEELTIKE